MDQGIETFLLNHSVNFYSQLFVVLWLKHLRDIQQFSSEKELVAQIQKEDRDRSLEKYLTRTFNHFDIEMEDIAARTYFLQPASIITEVFPSIPREGIRVTFDRKKALIREDISFLSWDHPMTTGAIDMVLSSETGSASFGVLRGAESPAILLELLFVLCLLTLKVKSLLWVIRAVPFFPDILSALKFSI